MVLVGCAALTASCKQAPVAQMEAEYAVLKVSPSDKVLFLLLIRLRSVAVGILIFIRKFPVSYPALWRKDRQCVKASLIYY